MKWKLVAKTRNGKVIDAVPHILESLRAFFISHPEAILDGELYNHDLKDNFNKITSLVRKQKPTRLESDTDASFEKKEKEFKERLKEGADTIQYWIYDAPLKGTPICLNNLYFESNGSLIVPKSYCKRETRNTIGSKLKKANSGLLPDILILVL